MARKPRNKASIDADAVARMMREQDEPEATVSAEPSPVVEPAPLPTSPLAAPPAPPVQQMRQMPDFDPGKLDGRTLRRTGREPFASRIKPETHEALKRIAYARRITIAEALEMAVAAFQDK